MAFSSSKAQRGATINFPFSILKKIEHQLSNLDVISLSLLEDSPDAENEFDVKNVRIIRSISRTPGLRQLRIRTLERQKFYSQNMLDLHDSASKERMKLNTDSMIEDAVISKQLKRRLGARRKQRSKQIATNIAESRSDAANIAVKSLM